ncbi:GT2 family glycosyltransferase/glycosyltransferase involved in cell wall biosynthesis [Sphingobium xenophagum]|uniref:GT2 family glycosyltransferase/glycosyltransferase involved in cell wall biosynthesis n=1 Tax=Sphingobium xenophagum TaxID=121428 RepID=A0ABU1WXG4_SPHXE|nr:DUF4214 domain-containing protein [Sphingobium xenophagum]MDR7153759.1 GT2 family glycosyltransferase/glycosyltransferase involved in cell wall biosynthesis [Sphingobium xenophagum]
MKLNLIIPVYRNVELVKTCLESISANIEEIRAYNPKIIVINDSPDDDDVDQYLSDRHTAGLIDLYIRNESNLGFVQSVNKGLAISRRNGAGALLINSDTITYKNTLAECIAVMLSDPQIGFVCPRSNNAAIATFPQAPNNLSGIATTPEICHISWESVYRYLPRYTFSPTAVGFYMLISPQVIANFGYLDEEFGTGYEEENDLVMRAGKVGYRAALANHAYAYHAGSASFMLHEMDLQGQQQSNLQKMITRHPEFLPLVQEFERSPEYRAMTQIKNLVPTAEGKLKVALNLLTMGRHHNGTNELINNFLRWCDTREFDEFEIHAICDKSVAEFHGIDRLERVKLRTEISPIYAVAIFFGQPFDLQHINVMEHLAPVNVYGMLDVIALDCSHLRHNSHVESMWSHVARNASGLFFISQFAEDTFSHRFQRKDRSAKYTQLLPTSLQSYAARYEGVTAGREHVLVMGNHFAHKAAGITGKIIADAIPSVSVIAMGDGSEATLRNLRQLQAGVLPDQEMNEIFSFSSVVILPSYYEGFGLSLMHALALGKPIVARDIPATREILATFSSVEGVYLYVRDSDLPELVRQAVAFGHSSAIERAPRTWDDWSQGLFHFATGLTAQPDLYDRLMDRIEDGDMLRLRHAVEDGASQPTAPTTFPASDNVGTVAARKNSHGASDATRLSPSVTIDVAAILALENEAFIETFYQHALGRRADPAGLTHHLALLSSGVSKTDMLRSILESPEFKERRANITVIGGELLKRNRKRRRLLPARH